MTNFVQKMVFPGLKREKYTPPLSFCIFELIYNLGQIILELYNDLVYVRSTTGKTKRDI